MSRPTLWLCRRCKIPLGEVRGNAVELFVRTVRLSETLGVVCPRCGEVRVWEPERVTTLR